ncbi:hypothetical protein NLI96_g987 [Meripilus lineatus]|uniref:Mitochondrial cytochrome c oxidase subunit VIa n=1 Tax=Meripilus lineatus TaxID=2056292 RepID=A0AAD5VBN2_9APHY|nr:hypothetical protein NLI96_g987 [Physisporinus lineatus]
MSMIARRSLIRALPRARGFAAAAGDVTKSSWTEKQVALKAHAAETANLWRKISFFVCIPGILIASVWVRNLEAEHAEHEAHIRAENDGHLPEGPAYEYMTRRVKPFPWGPNSLFFNPHAQKDLSE